MARKFAEQMFSFGPIATFYVIGTISFVTYTQLFLTNPFNPFCKEAPADSEKSYHNLAATLFELALCQFWLLGIYGNYFRAAYLGPGFVPLNWRPSNADLEKYLPFCEICNGFKPPRAHHCRRCGRCVLKMDHHCIWINICVGYRNQVSILFFLLFCPLGCLHSFLRLTCFLFRLSFAEWYYTTEPEIYRQLAETPGWFNWLILAAVCLNVGVIGCVGWLFVDQLKKALANTTSVEGHIVESSSFVFPFNLSLKENVKQLFTLHISSLGDCANMWPVKAGCSPFDVSLEQSKLKKKVRPNIDRIFRVFRDYDGSWLPILSIGWRTAFFPTLFGEKRLAVHHGDIVNVKYFRDNWMFGELLVLSKNGNESSRKVGENGWFPKACAQFVETKIANDHSKCE